MPRIRRAYQSDVNDPKEALDAQCNRLTRAQNDQHTLVVKSVICDRTQLAVTGCSSIN